MSSATTIAPSTMTAQMTAQMAKVDLQQGWDAYRKNAEPHGLAFGKAVYDFRATAEGVQGGTTFRATLAELGIPKSTAYFWMSRYEVSIGIRAEKDDATLEIRDDVPVSPEFLSPIVYPPHSKPVSTDTSIEQTAGRKAWTEEQVFDWLKGKHPALYSHYEAKGFPRWIPLPSSIEIADKDGCDYCAFHSSSRSCPMHGWTEKRTDHFTQPTAAEPLALPFDAAKGAVPKSLAELREWLPIEDNVPEAKSLVGKTFDGNLYVHRLFDKGAYDGSLVWLVENTKTGKAELWRSCDLTRIERKGERVNKCMYGAYRLYGGAPSPADNAMQSGMQFWENINTIAAEVLAKIHETKEWLKGADEYEALEKKSKARAERLAILFKTFPVRVKWDGGRHSKDGWEGNRYTLCGLTENQIRIVAKTLQHGKQDGKQHGKQHGKQQKRNGKAHRATAGK